MAKLDLDAVTGRKIPNLNQRIFLLGIKTSWPVINPFFLGSSQPVLLAIQFIFKQFIININPIR